MSNDNSERITESASNALFDLVRGDMLDGQGSFDEVMATYFVKILDNFDARLQGKNSDWVPDQLEKIVANLNWIRVERSVTSATGIDERQEIADHLEIDPADVELANEVCPQCGEELENANAVFLAMQTMIDSEMKATDRPFPQVLADHIEYLLDFMAMHMPVDERWVSHSLKELVGHINWILVERAVDAKNHGAADLEV